MSNSVDQNSIGTHDDQIRSNSKRSPNNRKLSNCDSNETTAIRLPESSLSPSLGSTPLKEDSHTNPSQEEVSKEGQQNPPHFSASEEETDEEDSSHLEQSNFSGCKENRFNRNVVVSKTLGEQSTKGTFMTSRNDTLDEIQEEDSSEMDDSIDYGNDSISDSASYDVSVHHKYG